MTVNDCMFYFSDGHCKILKTQKCEHCKFKKTERQYADGQKRSDEMLAAKGLRKCMRHAPDGTPYISVERV